MTQRQTFSELVWPDDPSDADLPVQWARSVSRQVLDWTWRAFDQLHERYLKEVNLNQPLEQLERDLTRNHFVEIQALFNAETDGFASLIPVHEWPELETRSPAPAKPPAYDLGFVHFKNRRWGWPIEAKVLKTPATLAEYLTDVREKFEAGIAAPLVGEGGMIAYLLSGLSDTFFDNLKKELNGELLLVPEFNNRAHRSSNHERISAPRLCLHHMAMMCK